MNNKTPKTLIFKVKGDEHKVTKGKSVAIDVEKLASTAKFVDYAVCENRLKQGLHEVFYSFSLQPNVKKTKDFVQWVVADVFKEEIDTLKQNGLEEKDVQRAVSSAASKWFAQFLKRAD